MLGDMPPPVRVEPIDEAGLERAAYAKVTWHIVPLLMFAYAAAYLARVNIGLAKLQMLGDLHLSEAVYGLGAGIFFIGYFIFEVPSNLLLHRIGARVCIARIMFLWGIVSSCMMFVSSAWMFYLLRFLLGAAEAGFFPGIVLYLTYWYPSQRRARTTALFMTSLPLSGLIGNPISGWILQGMEGWHGLAGWRWMFFLEGLPSIVIGIIVLFVLKDRIADAPWLNTQEKALLASRLAADVGIKRVSSIRATLGNRYIWLMTVLYFFLATGLYGISFWLPTFVKAAGVNSILKISLLTAIPFVFSIFCMMAVSRSSDRHRERRWHIALPSFAAALALVASVYAGHNLGLAIAALTIATMAIFTTIPLFWSLPTALLADAGAAVGIALINSLGNISGFVSQALMGWLSDITHSTQSSVYFLSAAAVVAALLTLAVPARMVNR
jgi:sugar phosphate permease